MIKIKGLSKSYNSNEVLKEINMEFSRGKISGIVGAVSYTHLTLPTICSV